MSIPPIQYPRTVVPTTYYDACKRLRDEEKSYVEPWVFPKDCYLRFYQKEQEELLQSRLTKPKKGNIVPWYWVTFTLAPEHTEVSHELCMKKILAICTSKMVKVQGYYGCREWTEKGVMHYHVLFYVPIVGKRGFGESHLSNFWKFGSMKILKPNGNTQTSIQNILDYIEKEEKEKPEKIIFGNKNTVWHINDGVSSIVDPC